MLDLYQIRAGRALLGVTQHELAQAAGISVASLNNIERGVAKPRRSTLQILEQTFADAGLNFDASTYMQALYFSPYGRPGAHDPMVSQEILLRYFNPDSLLKIRKIIFFTFTLAVGKQPSEGEFPQNITEIGVFLDADRRYILLDHVQFGFHHRERMELLGNILLQSYTLYQEQIFLCPQLVQQPQQLTVAELTDFFTNAPLEKMRHPRMLFDKIAGGNVLLEPYLSVPDHALRRLFTLLEHLPDGA